jgi:leader peptidase (prepilin peptidase) / N-methyltransferase
LAEHRTGAAARLDLPDFGLPLRIPSPLRIGATVAAVGLVVATFARFGLAPHALIAAFSVCVLVALSVVDLEERRIPNRIVLPSAAAVLAAQLVFYPERAPEWLIASLGAALFFVISQVVYPRGVGMGDVKLALLLGAALGKGVVLALLLGAFASVPVAIAVMARGGIAARKTAIPFGPFLAAGAIVALFLSKPY